MSAARVANETVSVCELPSWPFFTARDASPDDVPGVADIAQILYNTMQYNVLYFERVDIHD